VKKTVAELKSGATVARISHIQLELINNCLTLPLDEIWRKEHSQAIENDSWCIEYNYTYMGWEND